MSTYPCPHATAFDEPCLECEHEESLNAVGAANAVLTADDLLIGEEIEYQYDAGSRWCYDEYIEYANLRRNLIDCGRNSE